jgi:succinate dehydrogenase / fumarate reductase flavoprotein subunit
MKIFPAVHYSMGGLWTQYTKGSYTPAAPLPHHVSGSRSPLANAEIGQGMLPGAPNNMQTNIPGLYAFGEVNFAYHGANRLGANALLSCIFDGLFCGVSVLNYVQQGAPGKNPATGLPVQEFDAAVATQDAKSKKLMATATKNGDAATNPYVIGKELGIEMTAACTVVRTEARLHKCLATIASLRERYAKVTVPDDAGWTNQSFGYARSVGDMLALAEAIAQGALARRESRGAHYRTDYPTRDDANFMKTTVVKWNAGKAGCDLEHQAIDSSLTLATARTYGKTDSDPKKTGEKKEMAAAH